MNSVMNINYNKQYKDFLFSENNVQRSLREVKQLFERYNQVMSDKNYMNEIEKKPNIKVSQSLILLEKISPKSPIKQNTLLKDLTIDNIKN